MSWGAFASWSELMSGGVPLARRIYDAIWSNLTNGGRTPNYSKGGYTDAKVYAWSMALARWLRTARRLDAQISPDTVLELLAEREFEHGLVVPAHATIAQRRRALKLAMLAPGDGTQASLRQGLQQLLGASFVNLRRLAAGSLVNAPATPATGPGLFTEPTRPRKLFRLLDNISSTSGTFAYLHLDGTVPTADDGLAYGDRFVLEPEHNVLRERVRTFQVDYAPGLATFSVSGLTALQKPHHAGALLSTQPFPFWVSTRAHWIVQLTPAAAANRETTRLVHGWMHRAARATATWEIQGSTGPFLLNSSPLGTTPLG